MKKEYILELREYLEEYLEDSDLEEVIRDYEELYDDYKENGYSDLDIIKKLGSKEEIYKNITGTITKRITIKNINSRASVSPFLA